MGDVQLLQRSQLPPSMTSVVKSPDIPEISPVEAIAGVGSSIIQQIRASRAGNEQSEYLGFVATAQERAAAQIADNPGMSFEDMDKIQKQMMTEIDQAGKNLELPESKLYARNFALKNRQLIEEKFNTQKEAILTKHEFTRFNLERERLIAERKPDELNKLYEGVSGKLLDPEVATLSFENDLLTIDALQAKFDEEVARENRQAVLEQYAEAGRDMELAEATKFFNEISREEITEPERNSLIAQRQTQEGLKNEELEITKEKDRDIISNAIREGKDAIPIIEGSSLEESEQWTWSERARAESERLAKGEEIVTNPAVRSDIYSGIFQVLSGAKTKQEVLDEAKAARMPGMDENGKPIPPTLSEDEYQSFEKAINAQYEQAYTYQMGQVNRIAEGLLLNPDSLGYIKNAPIRYKTLGDFRKEWLQWIQSKGDTIKISEIYPEGMRMAAAHQISDEEAERQEIKMNERLSAREQERKEDGKAGGRAAVEAIKKLSAQADLQEFLGPTTRKGPRNNPQFIMKDGQPEMEYDVEGKEIGLKLEDGTVLKIGYHYRIGNNVWEYLGNGRAKRIK